MIEIHYHLVFGVDDGPQSMESALKLAEASIAEGTTHIVATPHSNDQYSFQSEINQARLAEIQKEVGNRLTLGLGCDFHLSDENLEGLAKDPAKYTINGKQYLLVELSDFGVPQSTTDVLQGIVESGLVPIVTHPERNVLLATHPERMAEWIRAGCLIQVTAGSLQGQFGSQAKEVAHSLVKNHWVNFVASDAHSVRFRPPVMQGAYKVLKQKYGHDVAERLCVENPLAVFRGEELGAQPEPVGVALKRGERPKQKGLLSRIFGGTPRD